ncbi:acyltransferase family protein [Streptomyces sp. NRRL WC-3742]|uniref:acyltransferase family protein n=1 Tax=Streptomyces sp. NRRL WC-3742 TaxID=1463934 RepID=UPI00099D3C6E|nr:acyltransferase [Streptomyces sp. NRRL WC-3742]
MSLISHNPPQQAAADGALPSAAPAKPRLGWLDALRGLAALTIVVQHFTQLVMPETFVRISRHVDLGSYGVFLFFLVSGYIVPASLERRGSVRGFWVSRLFRIYPLCLLVVLAGVAVWKLGYTTPALSPVHWFSAAHPAIAALGNATMLHDFLGVNGTLYVMWTLSYEMVFYLLVASLFVLGLHRRSAEISAGLAVVAVAAVGAFPVLTLFHTLPGQKRLVAATAAVMAVGLVAIMSRRRPLAILGALTLGGLATVLVMGHSRMPGWFSLVVLSTMFAGTAIYRAEQGQINRWVCWIGLAITLGAGLYVGSRYGETGRRTPEIQWQWPITLLAVWATFAVGMALRNRRMPRVLTWLGGISYSVYLVHAVLLCVLLKLIGPGSVTSIGTGRRMALGFAFCAAVLAVSHLTHRWIEKPAQKLGHRVTKLVDRKR